MAGLWLHSPCRSGCTGGRGKGGEHDRAKWGEDGLFWADVSPSSPRSLAIVMDHLSDHEETEVGGVSWSVARLLGSSCGCKWLPSSIGGRLLGALDVAWEVMIHKAIACSPLGRMGVKARAGIHTCCGDDGLRSLLSPQVLSPLWSPRPPYMLALLVCGSCDRWGSQYGHGWLDSIVVPDRRAPGKPLEGMVFPPGPPYGT